MYIPRLIDRHLKEWAESPDHKPLMLRGARQVGKSRAVEHLGESFKRFVKIDFEKNPEFCEVFKTNRDVHRIVPLLAALSGMSINVGDTLLFLDEIQQCPEAIMALRYFKEDMPGLHVVAAWSLLEFALDTLPTFGVARIHTMFMYPLSFDEFLCACNHRQLYEMKHTGNPLLPLPNIAHEKIVEVFRWYILIGGMPEVVARWIDTHDFIQCQELQDDIVMGYEADFPKYRSKVSAELLRNVLRSAAVQVGQKFVYSQVRDGWKAAEVKKALDLLYKAGLLVPVTRSSANGLPLGVQADDSYRKVLLMDSGLMLRLQNLTLDNATALTSDILTMSPPDLVNKVAVAEMIAGLEMLKYKSPNMRHELFYWVRAEKNSLAEVDYVISMSGQVLPIEVKAGQRGGMKSLWGFMKEKGIEKGVRSSLENFATITNADPETGRIHIVDIYPHYAFSTLIKN